MSLPSDDAEIAAWVTARLHVLDTTPRDKRWKTKALGMPVTVALSQAPRDYRLDLRVPVSEMRLLNDAARKRGLGTRTYVRKAVATMMAVDGFDPDDVPSLAAGGLLGPR